MGKSIRSSSVKRNHSIQNAIVRETVDMPRIDEIATRMEASIAAQEARLASMRASNDGGDENMTGRPASSSALVVPEATTAILRVSSKIRAKKNAHRTARTLARKVARRSGSSVAKFIGR